MKAILIIDEMPDSCLKCIYCGYKEDENQRVCLFMSQAYVLDGNLNKRHRMCPLKPLPQKKNTSKIQGFGHSQIMWTNKTIHQNEGWNACLEEIEKCSTQKTDTLT